MVERGHDGEPSPVAGPRPGPEQAATGYSPDIVGRLRSVSSSLVAELDLARVLQRLVDAAAELVGAEFGAFLPAGPPDVPRASSGPVPHLLAQAPSAAHVDALGPVIRGEGAVRLDGPDGGDLGEGSWLAYPVVSRSCEVLGALVLGHGRPGTFDDSHERVVAAVIAPAAIAIDNARLYQAADRARASAQRLAERLSQMQAVSARLAGAGTVDEVAAVVTSGAGEALGCHRASLFVLAEGGTALRLLHSFGYEGDLRRRWARIGLDERLPTTDALLDRRLVLVGDEQQWASRYPQLDPDPTRSVALAVIPLALGEQVFGVATFGWDSPQRFEEDDADFLESLADQCAQALERARLYELERETARTLQRSLLPPRAPEVPGLEVTALYRAGDRSVAVGGDFYDVFPLGLGRWGVAIGDVCGRGAAAASRTALVRYTLRAVATAEDDPVAVLRRVNDAVMLEPDADDRFCAAVYGCVEVDGGRARVTLACAGHPRPVVVRRAGWIDVRGQPGTLIGVLEDPELTSDRVDLGPGDALVFYTDGVSEARSPAGGQFADEELAATLIAGAGMDAPALAASIGRGATEFAGGTMGDDFAILVLRVPADARAEAGADWDGDLPTRPRPPRVARTSLVAGPPPTGPPAPLSAAAAAARFVDEALDSWGLTELVENPPGPLLAELVPVVAPRCEPGPMAVIVRYQGSRLRVEIGDGSLATHRQPPVGPGLGGWRSPAPRLRFDTGGPPPQGTVPRPRSGPAPVGPRGRSHDEGAAAHGPTTGPPPTGPGQPPVGLAPEVDVEAVGFVGERAAARLTAGAAGWGVLATARGRRAWFEVPVRPASW